MTRLLVALLVFFGATFGQNRAQAQFIKSIAVPEARTFTTDESGNIYVLRGKNELVRFDNNGDSTGFFRSVSNGEVSWIDATNPLRIMLYYQAFSKIVLLDRMLAPKNELDLKKLSIYNPSATGISADGKIWVYDFVNARLKKIDDQLNTNLTSNDMRMETQVVPAPTSLIEKEYKIYACDSAQGIFTFDRFGGYINTLEIMGVSKMQVVGKQLIYLKGDTLQAYDLQSFELKKMPLPGSTEDLIDARVERNRLFILYKNRLDIYQQND